MYQHWFLTGVFFAKMLCKEIKGEKEVKELEQVLPKAKIYIMNDTGETVKYLPLQQLENQTPPPAETGKKEAGSNGE